MINVIRHTNLMDRFKIRTKEPYVRFLCDNCDCIFMANGGDFDYKVVQHPKYKDKTILLVSSTCPDCNRKVYRHINDEDIYLIFKEIKNGTNKQ